MNQPEALACPKCFEPMTVVKHEPRVVENDGPPFAATVHACNECRLTLTTTAPAEDIAPDAPTQDTVTQLLHTKVIVTDRDVIVYGHASNKAACVAISAAVQTFANVAGMLKLLDRPVDFDPEIPRYHVHLEDSLEARRAIVGLMAAFAGIDKTCPGAMLFSDNRQKLDAAESLIAEGVMPPEDDRVNGGFAESVETGTVRAPVIQIPRLVTR